MPRHTGLLAGNLIRKSGLLLSMICMLVFSLAPLAHAQDADDEDGHDSHARIVRISYVEGEVRLDNGHGYENVTMNVPVTEHNWLQTSSDGWVEVQLEDGSMVRLAPDTVIAFTELGRSSSGGTITTVDLDQGEAEFKITKHDDSDFQVTVKNKTIVLVHSGSFRVTSTNANPMEIVVWKGDVAVRDPESGGEVAINKNETFVLDTTDVGRYALDKGTEADDLDQWSKQRDDYLSTYASANRNYTQSPYQYGVSDLNQYGQYYDVPGYGEVWQPTGVGLGWDPFSNGYWSYSPGFGYTWVSAYPWGWMPYRYGRWVFVNGRGWCWAPGGWNRWYSRPRIASAPPGFHAPIPPARRIVGGAPGHVDRSGNRPGNGGAGGRSSGPGGTRLGDRDGDNRAVGNAGGNRQDGRRQDGDRQNGNRGDRRVLTNDDVQARVPRTDVPAQTRPPAAVDGGRKPDRTPRTVEQEPAGGGRVSGRFGGDREPRTPVNRTPENRSNDASQPARQSGPPPQSYSPPNRQPEHQAPPPQSYSPPNRQPEHQAPPPQQAAPPVRQQAPAPPPPPPAAAPAQHQSSPPPESHVRQSDDSSRGKPK
jgi:FecR protein